VVAKQTGGPRLSWAAALTLRLRHHPQRTYLIFGDIEGKLDLPRRMHQVRPQRPLQCSQLIEKYGRKANMMKWKEQLNGDCPKRDAHSMLERCDLICPDLPKVL
jgi:hypothetical protein